MKPLCLSRVLAIGLLLAALLAPVPSVSAQSGLTIAYSVPGLGFPFFAVMLDGAAAAASERGDLTILPSVPIFIG